MIFYWEMWAWGIGMMMIAIRLDNIRSLFFLY